MAQGEGPDIFLIARPRHCSALPILAAAEAGRPVLPKAISTISPKVQAMLAAARKHKRVVQIGTQRRSTPHLKSKRAIVYQKGQARENRKRRYLLLLTVCAHLRSTRYRNRQVS